MGQIQKYQSNHATKTKGKIQVINDQISRQNIRAETGREYRKMLGMADILAILHNEIPSGIRLNSHQTGSEMER